MKTDRDIPPLVRDLIYARDHRLLDDEGGRAAVQALQYGVGDDLVRSLIQAPVRKHRIAQAFVGPFALPRLAHGDLVQGTDQHGRLIRFPCQYLNGHSLTIGGTGSNSSSRALFPVLRASS